MGTNNKSNHFSDPVKFPCIVVSATHTFTYIRLTTIFLGQHG